MLFLHRDRGVQGEKHPECSGKLLEVLGISQESIELSQLGNRADSQSNWDSSPDDRRLC